VAAAVMCLIERQPARRALAIARSEPLGVLSERARNLVTAGALQR
jgi:hypothetical protein